MQEHHSGRNVYHQKSCSVPLPDYYLSDSLQSKFTNAPDALSSKAATTSQKRCTESICAAHLYGFHMSTRDPHMCRVISVISRDSMAFLNTPSGRPWSPHRLQQMSFFVFLAAVFEVASYPSTSRLRPQLPSFFLHKLPFAAG